MATSGLVFVRLFMMAYVVSFLFTSNIQVVNSVPVAAVAVAASVAKLSFDTKNAANVAPAINKPELANSLMSMEHNGTSGSSKSTITTEKLKRGLSNFMNQLDAAPFFVPVNPHQTTSNNYGKLTMYSSLADKANAQKYSESPNSIKGNPGTIMKSPNRPMVQVWANGGPGRWGRR